MGAPMAILSHDIYENVRTRVLVVRRGRVLLLRPRSDDEGWMLPGGGLLPGETIYECASREVEEETGLTVVPKGIVFIREWVVPRFARADGATDGVGYGIEVGVVAEWIDVNQAVRTEAEDAKTPLWIELDRARELPVWPVELRELFRALAAGKSVSTVPTLIGRIEAPTAPSPAVAFDSSVDLS